MFYKVVIGVGIVLLGGCQLWGTHALPPELDGGSADARVADAGDLDGGGTDAARDSGPAPFRGLLAVIGDRPEVTGSCNALDDFAEMETRFTGSTRMNVSAGWEFDTDADAYNDPSYGFQPNWGSAPSERFSLRFTGKITLASAGQQCFSVDVGATGTGIVSGKNMCAQVYVNAGTGSGQATQFLVETGYDAASGSANVACVTLPAGEYPLDIVFWYFNVLERAKLQVRRCTGTSAACTPDQPIAALVVRP